MSIRALARPEIVALKPYAHAEWMPGLTRLHANEAPWRPEGDSTRAGLNRYPEPQPEALIARLAAFYGVPPANLLATRGSDEAIDVLSRIFLRSGEDAILQCTPTFGMYQVAARIQGADVVSIALEREQAYRLDPERLLAAWSPRVKLVYLCSPNNPTGNLLEPRAVEAVCDALSGRAVVVVDEAYIEWAGVDSATTWLERYPTLAVLRTLSKALALAGARLGALIGAADLIEMGRRVIPPYCLAQPTIEAALAALEPEALVAARARIAHLLTEREHVQRGLSASPLVSKIWPSAANFLMIESADADAFMRRSMRAGLIVRDLRANPALPRSLRVTIGTRAENDALLGSLARP
jgi:histidinol-phosphate aminotransferase